GGGALRVELADDLDGALGPALALRQQGGLPEEAGGAAQGPRLARPDVDRVRGGLLAPGVLAAGAGHDFGPQALGAEVLGGPARLVGVRVGAQQAPPPPAPPAVDVVRCPPARRGLPLP